MNLNQVEKGRLYDQTDAGVILGPPGQPLGSWDLVLFSGSKPKSARQRLARLIGIRSAVGLRTTHTRKLVSFFSHRQVGYVAAFALLNRGSVDDRPGASLAAPRPRPAAFRLLSRNERYTAIYVDEDDLHPIGTVVGRLGSM